MADKGSDKPAAFSPAFASLLNKANSSAPSKPNFGKKDQTMKTTAPSKFNFGKKDEPMKPTFLSSMLESQTVNLDMSDQCHTPGQAPTSDSPQPKNSASTPFAKLINKSKESKPASIGSSTLDTLSAKYLNSSVVTPMFGSTGSPVDITCPVFKRTVSSPADQSHAIRPLQQSGLPMSPEIQIPRPRPGIPQDTSSDYVTVSPGAKFTFSPLPNKAQSPGHGFPLSGSPDSKSSSLGKLKEQLTKNSRVESSCDGGSPHSPSLDDSKVKTFKFDLSSALVATKQNVKVASPGFPSTNVNLTPKRRTHDLTIVVDQLSCVLDARSLLDKPREQAATRRKRMSEMGQVICKRWKVGSCENMPVRLPVHHIPAFKFETMSPDDEIESKFKRRR